MYEKMSGKGESASEAHLFVFVELSHTGVRGQRLGCADMSLEVGLEVDGLCSTQGLVRFV